MTYWLEMLDKWRIVYPPNRKIHIFFRYTCSIYKNWSGINHMLILNKIHRKCAVWTMSIHPNKIEVEIINKTWAKRKSEVGSPCRNWNSVWNAYSLDQTAWLESLPCVPLQPPTDAHLEGCRCLLMFKYLVPCCPRGRPTPVQSLAPSIWLSPGCRKPLRNTWINRWKILSLSFSTLLLSLSLSFE